MLIIYRFPTGNLQSLYLWTAHWFDFSIEGIINRPSINRRQQERMNVFTSWRLGWMQCGFVAR
jgi:hypothetical protein